MTAVWLHRDGDGRPLLDPLELPFTYPAAGGAPPDRERLPLPPPGSYRHLRARRGAAGSERALLLAVSGSITITIGELVTALGPGDVVFVDDPDAAASAPTFADGAQALELTVGDEWRPGGDPVGGEDGEGRRDATEPPRIRNMYVEDGQARFRDFAQLFPADGPPSAGWPVMGAVFIALPGGTFGDWHTEEHTTLAFVLAGAIENGVGGDGGSIEIFRPGDVNLIQDDSGQGHTTRLRTDTRFLAIMLAEQP